MGGQGIMSGAIGSAGQMPNYGQQPIGTANGTSPFTPEVLANMKNDPTIMAGQDAFPTSNFNPSQNVSSALTSLSGLAPTNSQQNSLQSLQANGISAGATGSEPNLNGNLDFNSITGQNINSIQQQPTYLGNPVPNQNLQSAQNAFQSQYGTNPFVQAAQANAMGNIQGAQAATAANRVNQSTPFGNLTYTQTGTDAAGNPIWSANQTFSPEVAGAMSQLSNQIGQNIGQGFNPSLPSYGINPNEAYTDAIMRRLEPIQQRQQKSLETQLANQGIMRGSEAYQNAMSDFNQKQADQLTSAVVGGMQTGLQANQQAYNQALANYNLPLTQLGAYRQATAPTYINPYTQAAVSGPDILGAYTSSEAARIAQQNADAAKQAALTGGLFQLGGSALSNPSSVANIGSAIGSLGSSISDWWKKL